MWDRELPGQGQKVRASLFAAGMRGSANLACACVRGLFLAEMQPGGNITVGYVERKDELCYVG